MTKKNFVSTMAVIGMSVYFSGCAAINDGIADGVAYTAHSVTGIPYPMKNGKMFIESTTAKDTAHITPLNAQLHGFDNVVATNIMQCDSLPELTDVLTEHGWTITQNKEEADYQISTSVVYCGYASNWLEKSNREQALKDRGYFQTYKFVSKRDNLNITDVQIENEDKEALKKLSAITDVTKVNKNYFNVFDYKYQDAPEHIKSLVNSNTVDANAKLKASSDFTAHSIQTGANTMQYSGKGGTAMMAVGILMGMGGLPTYSGYKTEIKIYNPQTKATKIEVIEGIIPMNEMVKKYKSYRFDADKLASGLFYK